MSDDREWFAPKRYGLGAGLPIAWQGWAMLALYAAVVVGATALLRRNALAMSAIVLPATIILVIVMAQTTRGGWRWRWGKED